MFILSTGGYSQLAQSCDQTCLWLATGKLSAIYTLLLEGEITWYSITQLFDQPR